MKWLPFFFLSCALSNAAITEWYVTPAGAGTGTGTSEANAMNLALFVDHMSSAGTAAVPGARYNVKAGTYSPGANVVVPVAGTATLPIMIRGYGTTPGDGYLGRTGSTGALVTTNMPVFTMGAFGWTVSGAFILVENISITSTLNGIALSMAAANGYTHACKVALAASGTSSVGVTQGARNVIFNCDVDVTNGGNAGSAGVSMTTAGAICIGNRVKSTAKGILVSAINQFVANNLVYECGGNGIETTASTATATILGNTVVSNVDGIKILAATTNSHIMFNNMITDNSGFGINMTATSIPGFPAFNRLRDNVSGNIGTGGDWVTGTSQGHVTTDTGGAATDYTNAAVDDFSLISTSPAVNAAQNNFSMGALQRSGSSGTSSIIGQ